MKAAKELRPVAAKKLVNIFFKKFLLEVFPIPIPDKTKLDPKNRDGYGCQQVKLGNISRKGCKIH